MPSGRPKEREFMCRECRTLAEESELLEVDVMAQTRYYHKAYCYAKYVDRYKPYPVTHPRRAK